MMRTASATSSSTASTSFSQLRKGQRLLPCRRLLSPLRSVSQTQVPRLQPGLDDELSNRHIELDPLGYFIIFTDPETKEIVAEHYTNTINKNGVACDPDTGKPIPCTPGYRRAPKKVYRGRSAKELSVLILEKEAPPPVTRRQRRSFKVRRGVNEKAERRSLLQSASVSGPHGSSEDGLFDKGTSVTTTKDAAAEEPLEFSAEELRSLDITTATLEIGGVVPPPSHGREAGETSSSEGSSGGTGSHMYSPMSDVLQSFTSLFLGSSIKEQDEGGGPPGSDEQAEREVVEIGQKVRVGLEQARGEERVQKDRVEATTTEAEKEDEEEDAAFTALQAIAEAHEEPPVPQPEPEPSRGPEFVEGREGYKSQDEQEPVVEEVAEPTSPVSFGSAGTLASLFAPSNASEAQTLQLQEAELEALAQGAATLLEETRADLRDQGPEDQRREAPLPAAPILDQQDPKAQREERMREEQAKAQAQLEEELMEEEHLPEALVSALLDAAPMVESTGAPTDSGDLTDAIEIPIVTVEPGQVLVNFRWPAALGGSSAINVVGSFNNWVSPLSLEKSHVSGDFVRTIGLPPGIYQYKYVVNENDWRISPCEPTARDEQGCVNNQRVVAPTTVLRWKPKWGGSRDIFVLGSFNGWNELLPLTFNNQTRAYEISLSLLPGHYWYQFYVDGMWLTSPDDQLAPDDNGHVCNHIMVDTPAAYHLFYATGWTDCYVHYREPGEADWKVMQLHDAPSRDRPMGGRWRSVSIPAPLEELEKSRRTRDLEDSEEDMTTASGRSSAIASTSMGGVPAGDNAFRPTRASLPTAAQQKVKGRRLEFYLSNHGNIARDGGYAAKDDRPRKPDGFYTLEGYGGYKLSGGRILPFRRATKPPIMLVSDLDGTMVGEGPVDDAATAKFCQYWEGSAALCGSKLVYNTGRSIGSFTKLYEEKAGKLAMPDVIITAVGTKIFLNSDKDYSRTNESTIWREDERWCKWLDEGWNLDKVRRTAQEVMDHMRDANGIHWLDNGSEHQHRIALSVRADLVENVKRRISERLEREGVKAQLITSGKDGWRYLDVVASRAGKQQALEYVRTLYGIARERTVACGDSCNDILMLEGSHPAIVVGNAQQELLEWLNSVPQSDRIVLADNPLALGILEGLGRHGLY